MISDIKVNKLSKIKVNGGDVLHAIKNDDYGYKKFAECYFSFINFKHIKGWKKHKLITLNIVVPIGNIRFVIFDERKKSKNFGQFQEVIIGNDNYCRLTIPPMVWLGFQGLTRKGSMLLNIANIEHDVDEVDRLEIDQINYNWSAVQ